MCSCEDCKEMLQYVEEIARADEDYRQARSFSDIDIALHNLADVVTRIRAKVREKYGNNPA